MLTKQREYSQLDGTARYAGFLLAPAEDFGRRFFGPLGKKWVFFYAVLAHFKPFWCSEVTLVICSSNISNIKQKFKKKKSQELKKKIQKISKNPQNFTKILKNPKDLKKREKTNQ